MDRTEGNLLTHVGGDAESDRAVWAPPDRHDRLSSIPWASWFGDVPVADFDPAVHETCAAPAGTVGDDDNELADVPWALWALDHPREAEHAEAWLRSTDLHLAGSHHLGAGCVEVETSSAGPADDHRLSDITPWLIWAIDHPCEAERAEAWLDEVVAGEGGGAGARRSSVNR